MTMTRPDAAAHTATPASRVTLKWLTNTGTSGARLYSENNANNVNAVDISIPGCAADRLRRAAGPDPDAGSESGCRPR